MKVLKKSLSVLLNILVCIIIVIATVFVIGAVSAKQNGGVPSFLGYSPVVVLSGSMEGTNKDSFSKGDVVVVGKTDTTKLKVNDVISFWDLSIPGSEGKRQLNTHRIISIDKSKDEIQFVTKGDHNPTADLEERPANDVVGIYKFKVVGAGNFVNFLGSKWGFFLCLVLPLFLFFIWRLIKLVMAVVEYKNHKPEEEKAEEKAEPIAVEETTTRAEVTETAAEPEVTEEAAEPEVSEEITGEETDTSND